MVRLSAPIVSLLAAGAAAVPASFKRSTCSELSQTDFAWDVSNFALLTSEVFTTPAHQNDQGQISFDVANPVFPGKAATHCSGYSSQAPAYFYASQIFTCTAAGAPEGGLTTTFSYDTASGTLALNQSWSCSGENSAFSYQGTAVPELSCTENNYTNPAWSMGQIFSNHTKACSAETFELSPSCGTAVA